jgi:hypothetical protein
MCQVTIEFHPQRFPLVGQDSVDRNLAFRIDYMIVISNGIPTTFIHG